MFRLSLANQITLSRIVLTFVFMFFVFKDGWVYQVSAFVVFLIAALTDLIDGRVARHFGEASDFGRLMDPIADKILILSAFLAFLELKLIVSWMVVLIVARELLITGLRLQAASTGVILSAGRLGKHKTVTQSVAILIILMFLVFRSLDKHFTWIASEKIYDVSEQVIFFVMVATVILTLSSGILYITRNWSRISHAASGKSR